MMNDYDRINLLNERTVLGHRAYLDIVWRLRFAAGQLRAMDEDTAATFAARIEKTRRLGYMHCYRGNVEGMREQVSEASLIELQACGVTGDFHQGPMNRAWKPLEPVADMAIAARH